MIAYAITDSSILDFTRLQNDLQYFSTKASMIVYRDKNTDNYAKNAKLFLKYASNFDRVLLHGDYNLAKKLEASAVHLTSTQFKDISKAKHLGLFVVISVHGIEEALMAEKLGADMITLSPIFNTANKGMPIGLDVLKEVVNKLRIPVIALGGILTQEKIDSCLSVGASGFASIRYFSRNALSSL